MGTKARKKFHISANLLAQAINRLEGGKPFKQSERDNLVGLLTSEKVKRIDNKMIEHQREALLGLLLYMEPETHMISERERLEKLFQLARKKHQKLKDLLICDPGAKDEIENCIGGILRVASIGGEKNEIIEAYIRNRRRDGEDALVYKQEILPNNEESRKRLSETIDNLLRIGVLSMEDGIIRSLREYV